MKSSLDSSAIADEILFTKFNSYLMQKKQTHATTKAISSLLRPS